MDAYAAVQEALCAPIDIINETTLTDIEFKGCIVNLENVTVQDGTKLTVGAYKETNITGPFEVENGAEFEAGPSVY